MSSCEPGASDLPDQPTIRLASRSPRRRELLESAGFTVEVAPRLLDDTGLRSGGISPRAWVQALAYLKARFADDHLPVHERSAAHLPLLAADTLCVVDGEVLGQPADEDHARWMLGRLSGRAHDTLSGVCLLAGGQRIFLFDAAQVTLGPLTTAQVEEYVRSGAWRGKAGGYNLFERTAAGWPLSWVGDSTTVIGLPMTRVLPVLRKVLAGERGG